MYNLQTLLHVFLWGSLLCYVVSFVPQLLTNYRRGSTAGLSYLMVFANFYSYVNAGIYANLLNLPLPLRILLPAGACVSLGIVLQQWWYAESQQDRWYMAVLYGIGLVVSGFFVVQGQQQPMLYGDIAGWVGSGLWLSYNIPQLIRFYQKKSVRGFNFLVAVMNIIGSLIECIAAVGLGLPIQTFINGSSCFVFGLLYVYKFSRYSDKPWREWMQLPQG